MFLNVYLFNAYTNRSDLHYATTFIDPVNVVEQMEQMEIELPEFDEENHNVRAVQANETTILADEAGSLEGQAGSVSSDGSYYTSFLTNPIELSGNVESGFTDQDYNRIENFVNSDQVLFGEEYTYGHYDMDRNRFLYFQEVYGLPVMDGTSQISLFTDSNSDIFSYHQLYAGPMTQQGEVQETITDLRAVKILFQNNDIPPGSIVEKPILSYHRTLELEDVSMYTPVWVVPINNSSGRQILRVHALNETIIQQSVDLQLDEEMSDEEDDGENDQDQDESDQGDTDQDETNQEDSDQTDSGNQTDNQAQ